MGTISLDKRYISKFHTKISISDGLYFNLRVSEKSRFFIITDSIVAKLHLDKVVSNFSILGAVEFFIIDSSESSKSWEVVGQLIKAITKHSPTKMDYIVALGGGVVTDVAGFIASIINRGVKLILIPTTLLSMIDSSIGGKNGINLTGYKNIIGTIYPAHYVFINTKFLKTLNFNNILEGVCEAIKLAVCLDAKFFNFIKSKKEKLLELDYETMVKFIKRSIQLKNRIVAKDLKDNKKRAILNFGHTIGHAIESISNFTCPHGIAVGMGIRIELDIFVKKRLISKKLYQKISDILDDYKIPYYKGESTELIKLAENSDKKRSGNGLITMPVPKYLGKTVLKRIKISD